MKYRQKPVDTIQWDGRSIIHWKNRKDWPEWLLLHYEAGHLFVDSGLVGIDTLEGEKLISSGDWIIQGTQGELKTCKPDIFADIYEPVDDVQENP